MKNNFNFFKEIVFKSGQFKSERFFWKEAAEGEPNELVRKWNIQGKTKPNEFSDLSYEYSYEKDYKYATLLEPVLSKLVKQQNHNWGIWCELSKAVLEVVEKSVFDTTVADNYFKVLERYLSRGYYDAIEQATNWYSDFRVSTQKEREKEQNEAIDKIEKELIKPKIIQIVIDEGEIVNDFKRKYPASTSADLQTFVLGMQAYKEALAKAVPQPQ